ncbi:hypothetical protein HanRHA438_Chr07g0320301 [Helianthus annuus]|nr:hypothetical protein HanHA300_Chr07g0256551 [Helianthus annuus]KAJ0564346.1 hypothetical protein HanHA89_Chr07g0273331 [Helianthus annuus]KAJ0732412.1 hypothetical protein HanOQP8_Chr07g0262951 [Helianthus annuus]KAJ0906042.1 hypothetical protein HanPSC8_Chr07g0300991 [Helianthus annuus]KAJ0909317.1 hypothetical protein HanRHA438_Chr07g0320301 [Helianthus annuus]
MRLQVSSNKLSHSKFKFIVTKPNLQNKFQNPEKKREKRSSAFFVVFDDFVYIFVLIVL